VALVIAGLSLLPATAQAQKPPDQTTPPKETPAGTPVEQPSLPKSETFPQQCPASGSDEKITALADKMPALEDRYRLQEVAYENDDKNYHALKAKLGADDPKTIAADNQVDDSRGKLIRTKIEIDALEKQIKDLVNCPPAACRTPEAVDAEIAALQRWRAARKARVDAARRWPVAAVQRADKVLSDPKASENEKADAANLRGSLLRGDRRARSV
jgi:hypothetical protein